jgi:Mg/Co/Ni transporter MgtE
LPAVYENVPKPTTEADAEALDSDTRTALDDEVFQLTGAWRVEEAIDPSPLATVWLRGGWLIAGLIVGFAGLIWSALYSGKPQRLAELSLLAIPLVFLVDAVALQSAAVTGHTLKSKLLRRQTLWRDAGREMLNGLYLGLAGGILLAGLAAIWSGSARLGICLLLSAVGGSALAAGTGLLSASMLRIAPARPWMAAGPIARAAAAIAGLLLYFLLARLWGV